MKIHIMFCRLVVFTVVLTFSFTFATLAQQNSEQTGVTATLNAEALRLEAKIAAEQDADSDINKLLWVGTGMGATVIGSTAFACVGCAIGSMINPEPDDLFGYPLPNDTQMIATIIGCLVGGVVPLIGIFNYKQPPSPVRLIGKSPEYVEYYTNAYKSKMRSLRTKLAAAGTTTVYAVMIAGYLIHIQ